VQIQNDFLEIKMAGVKGMKGGGGARTGAGRKKLPTAIKRIKGTLQPSRSNRDEARATTPLGDPPEYMSDVAKQAWAYALEHAPRGLLSSLDAAILERWANCAGLYREALSKINRAGVSGMIIKTPSGSLRRSPLMDVIRDLAQEMKSYESEMGFTPASRARVQVPKEANNVNDPWADIAG
jgi:P27 family predicted phage terminase small subunit